MELAKSSEHKYSKSLIIARYLVEDNTDDYIDFDPDRSESIIRVTSVFKKLVNNYSLYTEEKDVTLRKDVAFVNILLL